MNSVQEVVLPQQINNTRWDASLSLVLACQGNRTVLVRRTHHGPLVVQKVLYPEGEEVCHAVVVHPPGGIAGGDHLAIQAELGAQAHSLLTTPGAGKWYKAAGQQASQSLHFSLSEGSCLEWLPQENILFDGADVLMSGKVELAKGAVFLGAEILCFGRQARGERWQQGRLKQRLELRREGRLVWQERTHLKPDSPAFVSPAGLRGQQVSGSLVLAAGSLPIEVLEACRRITVGHEARFGVTALPEVFAARYLGKSSQQARHYFEALWQELRPWYAERAAVRPRIWNT